MRCRFLGDGNSNYEWFCYRCYSAKKCAVFPTRGGCDFNSEVNNQSRLCITSGIEYKATNNIERILLK